MGHFLHGGWQVRAGSRGAGGGSGPNARRQRRELHLTETPQLNASPLSQIAAQPQPSAAVAKFLKRAPRLFIGGEWVESRSKELISVLDPATGREISQVVDANAADVDRAVAAARAAFESGPWADMLPSDRQALLWKLSDLVEKNLDELAELESINNGKTKFMATVVDVTGTRDYFRYMAGWATKIEGATFRDLDPRTAGCQVPHLHATAADRGGGTDRAVELPARDGRRGSSARHWRRAAPVCSSPPSRLP